MINMWAEDDEDHHDDHQFGYANVTLMSRSGTNHLKYIGIWGWRAMLNHLYNTILRSLLEVFLNRLLLLTQLQPAQFQSNYSTFRFLCVRACLAVCPCVCACMFWPLVRTSAVIRRGSSDVLPSAIPSGQNKAEHLTNYPRCFTSQTSPHHHPTARRPLFMYLILSLFISSHLKL